MTAVLLTSLQGSVLAGGDAKAGPKAGAKPLPPEVVKAWTDCGLEFGGMHMKSGLPSTYVPKNAPADAVPAFRLGAWKENTVAKLPDPGAPFGLSLYYSDVKDAGLKELAGLKSLQSLNLAGTKVTDAGLKELSALKNLQSLSLGGCPNVTDAGLKELASLKSLQALDLSATKVKEA